MWTQIRLWEQSDQDLHCLLKRLQNVSLATINILSFVIFAFRVNNVRSGIYRQDFHEMHAQKAYKLIIKL